MGFDASGKFTARTEDELREMLQMALYGGPKTTGSATLGLDSPIVAAATSFLPGVTNGLEISGPVSTAVGAPSTSLSMATSKATGAGGGILSNLNNLRKGYEAGVQPLVNAQTKALTGLLPQGPIPAKGGMAMKATRFAGNALKNPAVQKALAYAPVIGAGLSIGDLVLGDESFGNKAMDATAMTVGGAIGSVVPVVGTGLGIAAGKMASDATQWLFGDKKTPEQRKMELALAQLNGGII